MTTTGAAGMVGASGGALGFPSLICFLVTMYEKYRESNSFPPVNPVYFTRACNVSPV